MSQRIFASTAEYALKNKRTRRELFVAPKVVALLKRPRASHAQIKAEALWVHDQALDLHWLDFMRAIEARTAFHSHLLTMFERFDVLALPVTQVWPFAIGERWPQAVAGRAAGRAMDTYQRWMESRSTPPLRAWETAPKPPANDWREPNRLGWSDGVRA